MSDVMLANVEALARYELPEVDVTCDKDGGTCWWDSGKDCYINPFIHYPDCEFCGYTDFSCQTPCWWNIYRHNIAIKWLTNIIEEDVLKTITYSGIHLLRNFTICYEKLDFFTNTVVLRMLFQTSWIAGWHRNRSGKYSCYHQQSYRFHRKNRNNTAGNQWQYCSRCTEKNGVQ